MSVIVLGQTRNHFPTLMFCTLSVTQVHGVAIGNGAHRTQASSVFKITKTSRKIQPLSSLNGKNLMRCFVNYRKSKKSSMQKTGKRAVRKIFFSELCEVLEPRIAPAVLINARQVVYTDIDGDLVRVSSDKPVFSPSIVDQVFQFDSGSVDGHKTLPQQLQSINLSALGVQANDMSLSVNAVRGKTGDGLVNIGSVNARSIKLGSVRIDGDLGQILASRINRLSVNTLGKAALASQAGGNSASVIDDSLGSLLVQSSLFSGLAVHGPIGSVQMGGSLVGGSTSQSGSIVAAGVIGQVRVKGSILGGAGNGSGVIDASMINQIVVTGHVMGGSGQGSGVIHSGQGLKSVLIRGNVNGGAGSQSGLISTNQFVNQMTIQGSIIGGSGFQTGGVQASGEIKSIRIEGNLVGGPISKSGAVLSRSGYIAGGGIGSVLVGGSVISAQNGNTNGAASQLDRSVSGAILSFTSISTLTVHGELLGNQSQPVTIIAAASESRFQQANAIGRLTVGQNAKWANIVAGIALDNHSQNADAKLGSITVKGDWISSNIYAGVAPSGSNGTTVARLNEPGVIDSSGSHSQISSVRIDGQALNLNTSRQTGLYADEIQNVSVAGKSIKLTPGPGNDAQNTGGSGGNGGNGGLLISEKPQILGRPAANSQTYLQPLATDPTVYSAITGSTATVKSGQPGSTAPTLWGDALAFPAVNQSANQGANVPQPRLQLPATQILPSSLNQGFTYSTWFQARGAGVLLNVPLSETSTGIYDSPLVYINDTGNLVGGLYDNTPMSIVPGETILSSYLPNVGPATNSPVIGAAYPITSSTQVIDGSWHHVALVASASSESLYLDGMLVGTSVPQYHQVNTGLQPGSGNNSITILLDQTPTSNQVVTGSIWQKNVDGQNNDNLTQIATYQFTQFADGTVGDYKITNTYGNLGLTANHSSVSSISYSPTSKSLAMNFSGAQITSNASITVYTNYQSATSAYALTPISANWYAGVSHPSQAPIFSDVKSTLEIGGTVYPQPDASPYPTINYPQGFTGAVDEVALWGVPLTQSQIQMAMSGPLSGQSSLQSNLIEYFNFNNESYANDVNSTATNPAVPLGTVVQPVFIQSSVPTNPYGDLPRLPGYQNWGLKLMTPLASSNIALQPNTPVDYVVSLMANDQLELSLPGSPSGTLTATVEDSIGNTDSVTITGGTSQYLAVAQTGSFKLTLNWQPISPGAATSLACTALPGILNSLPSLTGTFTTQTPTGPVISYSYADPTLPGLLTPSQVAANAGPANYWPLWTDTTYFPVSALYNPSYLATSYQMLLNSSAALGGPTDFCNINGQSITNPANILSYLNAAYKSSFGTAPPTPPAANQPFPVKGESSPQLAVYKFLYNANLMRTDVYQFFLGGGSTSEFYKDWVQKVLDSITEGTQIPDKIASEISSGQTAQDSSSVTITTVTPSKKESQGQIFERMSISLSFAWISGGLNIFNSLVEEKDRISPTKMAIVGLIGGIGVPIAQSELNNLLASGASTSSSTYNVDITQITNSSLNYETLQTMAQSIDSSMQQSWNSILNSINDSYLQKIMSNYGLLQALQTITAKPLGDSAIADPSQAVSRQLTQTAWSQMIPASFKWQQIPPTNYPTADGYADSLTTGLSNFSVDASYPPIYLPPPNVQNAPATKGAYDVATGDFNNDGNQDFVVTNAGSNTFTVGLGDGHGNFPVINTYYIDTYNGKGSSEPEGVEVADFNHDGNLDIVMAIHGINNGALVYWGNGSGTNWGNFTRVNFGDGPQGLAIADFNQDGYPDFAAADNYSQDVKIFLYNPENPNHFITSITIAAAGDPARLAAASYNGKTLLAVAAGSRVYVYTISPDLTYGTWSVGGNHSFGVCFGTFESGDNIPDLAFTTTGSSSSSYCFYNGAFNEGLYAPFYQDQGLSQSAMDNSFQGLTALTLPGRPLSYLAGASNDGSIVTLGLNQIGNKINMQGATGMNEVAVADFNNDGIPELISANNDSGNVSIIALSPTGNAQAVTTLTQNLQNNSPDPLTNGSATLSKDLSAAQLQALFWQVNALQGGNAVFIPNSENIADPRMWQVKTPYAFITVNAASSASAYGYCGSFLTAWNLYDYNGHPIAQSTAQSLFGNLGRGVQLTPLDPNAPLKNIDGAWFMPTIPLSGAATTWADAFFNWGQSTPGYGGNPIPTNTNWGQSKYINWIGAYFQINDLPPDLTSATGLVSDGNTFSSNGGIDGKGNAYSANLLNSPINGITPGFSGQPNITRGYGQTIALPNGSNGDTTLQLLATGVNGAQTNQEIVINFADGSSQLFVQSFSDWLSPGNFAGESTAATQSYYNNSAGSTVQKQNYVYSYNFQIPQNKIPISVTLPYNTNLVVLGMKVS